MQIKSYNRAQLNEFIHSDFYSVLNKIPISYTRAISQINNPNCNDDDILLWAAFEKASLVGYVGTLPDKITLNNIQHKIYWLSCFWVDENFRNINLASQLFFPLIKQYRNQLFISNFLFSLEKTYQGLGIFKPTQYIYGNTFYVRLSFANIIQAKFHTHKSILSLYKILESFTNKLLEIRHLFYKHKKPNKEITENELHDNEIESFLKKYAENSNQIVRNREYLDWVNQYPWIITGKTDIKSERYYFSSKSEQFEYRFLKLTNKGTQEGFALIKIRDNKLAVSYLYSSDYCIENLAQYLIKLSYTEKLNTITCYDNRLNNRLKNEKYIFIYIKKIKKPYIFPKNFNVDVNLFQEGDGDAVFT